MQQQRKTVVVDMAALRAVFVSLNLADNTASDADLDDTLKGALEVIGQWNLFVDCLAVKIAQYEHETKRVEFNGARARWRKRFRSVIEEQRKQPSAVRKRERRIAHAWASEPQGSLC